MLNAGIRIGMELSKEELDELKERAGEDKAYDRVLRFIAIRQRSEWEVRQYLRRKNYDDEQIEKLLNKLSKRGFINDETFARAWVESRRLLKPISKRRLTQELRQKHVDPDIISTVLSADETDEREVLRQLIARKRKQTKYQDNLKLMQYLARQGYRYEDIKSQMDELSS